MGWFKSERKENKRITDLENRMSTVQTDLHALDVDMHLLWDKVRVALGRISKRAAILESTETQNPEPEPPQLNESPAVSGRIWNQHQREEQERILRRRAGL